MAATAKTDVSILPKPVADRWKGELTHISYGQEDFRFWWLGNGQQKVTLNPWVESFSWDDTNDAAPVITGSCSLRQSLVQTPIPPIQAGDLMVVEMRRSVSASWKQLMRLRVEEPQRLASGQFTFQLANDAALLALGTDSWHFPHDKAHKGGWFPWQIVEEVGRRSHVRIVMPKVGKRIRRFLPMMNSSPIDVINAAMQHVRVADRKTLVRRFEAGTLYMSERHYSPSLMTLGKQLIEASLVVTKKPAWATALTVRTKVEVAHDKAYLDLHAITHRGIVVELPGRKIVGGVTVRTASSTFIKRYGYVHQIVYAHGTHSVAEARERGLAHMARVLQPDRTLTITAPFLPDLRRGAYLRLNIPTLGLTQIVHVKAISVSVSPGSLTMQVTIGFDDPIATPAVDRVSASTANLNKKINLSVNSSKTDKNTKKPLPQVPNGFGVNTP